MKKFKLILVIAIAMCCASCSSDTCYECKAEGSEEVANTLCESDFESKEQFQAAVDAVEKGTALTGGLIKCEKK